MNKYEIEYNENIYNLASTCTRTTAVPGNVITITTNGTGGVAPYTAFFSQTNGSGTLSQSSQSGLAEGANATSTYTVVAADAGKIISFNSYVLDSCSGNPQYSSAVSCSVQINATPTTGSIVCSTTPVGAQIWIDGINTGYVTASPTFTVTNVTAGTRTIVFKLSGYNDCTVSVSVPAGGSVNASCTLTAATICTATTSTSLTIANPTTITCNSTAVPSGTAITFKATNIGGSGTGIWEFALINADSGTLLDSWTTVSNQQNFAPTTLSLPGTYRFMARSRATCESAFTFSSICTLTVPTPCAPPTANMTVT